MTASTRDRRGKLGRSLVTPAGQKGATRRTEWMEPPYRLRWPELALVLDLAASRIDHQTFVRALEQFDWPNEDAVDLADLLCWMFIERPASMTADPERRDELG